MNVINVNLLTFLLYGFLITQAFAEPQISYRGIAAGKAIIKIDGRLARLSPGQKSKEGYKLLTANRKIITLLIDGKRYQYEKGKITGILLDNEVELVRNPLNGSYLVLGAINGKDARFLVDTGASFVVINKKDAKTLNIKFGKKKIKVSTATKDEIAYLVTLKSVRVGSIELKNITAVVSNNESHPRLPLLGMSFLDKLQITKSGDKMTLSYRGE